MTTPAPTVAASTEPLGNDTVTILKRTPQTNPDGSPKRAAKGIPILAADTPIVKTGCSFQSQRESKRTTDVVVGEVKAHCYLPVDADSSAITDRDALQFRGQLYEMEGPAMVRTDPDTGAPVHVKCVAWWVRGDQETT